MSRNISVVVFLSLLPFISALNLTDSHILQDVLKQISVMQRWDLQTVRVSRLDSTKLRFGNAQSFDFRIGFGNSHVVVLFPDDFVYWRKFREPRPHLASLINDLTSVAALNTFTVEGPFELQLHSDHDVSLSLPMNITYGRGLKRVLVGQGVTVEVTRAIQVSVFHSSDLGSPLNGSDVTDKRRSGFWPFWHSHCAPLALVRVSGPASLVAYRTRNPVARIATKFISEEIVELLSEKCFSSYHMYKKQKQSCPINALCSKISMLERIWKGLLRKGKINASTITTEGKIKASTVVRFKLQLERDFRRKGILQQNIPEWRTMPDVERVWFEVLARVESQRLRLRPILVKNIRPLIIADSAAWENPSNMSFTKSDSILVAPEALTLDVKW